MNTDNMSLLGLTIDYGPYGWLEEFAPAFTPNTTDLPGRRYRYGAQPAVAEWNLVRFAEALFVYGEDEPSLVSGLQEFQRTFARLEPAMLRSKLGLTREDPGDTALFAELFQGLASSEADFTLFFRELSALPLHSAFTERSASADAPRASELAALPVHSTASVHSASAVFLGSSSARPAGAPEVTTGWLTALAPVFYRPLSEESRAQLHGALTRLLLRVRAEEAASGLSPEDFVRARRSRMEQVNPRFIPRNFLAVEATTSLAQGDDSFLRQWMDVLRRPYDEQPGAEHFGSRRPEWARNRPGCATLSCSS